MSDGDSDLEGYGSAPYYAHSHPGNYGTYAPPHLLLRLPASVTSAARQVHGQGAHHRVLGLLQPRHGPTQSARQKGPQKVEGRQNPPIYKPRDPLPPPPAVTLLTC